MTVEAPFVCALARAGVNMQTAMTLSGHSDERERSNFNNADEVAGALLRSGLPTAALNVHGVDLESMMKRRHWIVRRADRNQAQGQGQFAAQSLHPSTVKAWTAAVETFGSAVLALL